MLNHSKEDCPQKDTIKEKDPIENEKKRLFLQSISERTRGLVNSLMTRKVLVKYPHHGAYRTNVDREVIVPSRLARVAGFVSNKKVVYPFAIVAGLATATTLGKYGYEAFTERDQVVDTNFSPDYLNKSGYPPRDEHAPCGGFCGPGTICEESSGKCNADVDQSVEK